MRVTHGPMLAYAVDVSRWPLIAIGATTAVRDAMALDATYATLEGVLGRKQPFVCLIDVRGAASDPARRKRFASWIEAHRAALDRYSIAIATIVGTTIERGIVTAALWLVQKPGQMRVFTDVREAESWLQERYHQAKR